MERIAPGPGNSGTTSREETILNLKRDGIRAVNQFLHAHQEKPTSMIRIEHPDGAHNIAVGLDADIQVHVNGHAGYYAGGMNKLAHITVHGNVERGVAENMMSGSVRVKGNASECAGASAHGGLLVIEGDAAGRCGISLKGADIVVGGSVGHSTAFMAQSGRILICGDAGPGLGDSLYEAVIYVRGKIAGLGTDAREEAVSAADHAAIAELLSLAGINLDPNSFKRVASARALYHWNAANHGAY